MMARRGKLANIWSDNGTNFVGSERELRDAHKRLGNERVVDQLSNERVEWHFTPRLRRTLEERGNVSFSLLKERLKQLWEDSVSMMKCCLHLWQKWSHY